MLFCQQNSFLIFLGVPLVRVTYTKGGWETAISRINPARLFTCVCRSVSSAQFFTNFVKNTFVTSCIHVFFYEKPFYKKPRATEAKNLRN